MHSSTAYINARNYRNIYIYSIVLTSVEARIHYFCVWSATRYIHSSCENMPPFAENWNHPKSRRKRILIEKFAQSEVTHWMNFEWIAQPWRTRFFVDEWRIHHTSFPNWIANVFRIQNTQRTFKAINVRARRISFCCPHFIHTNSIALWNGLRVVDCRQFFLLKRVESLRYRTAPTIFINRYPEGN